jgi:hypothetical protein
MMSGQRESEVAIFLIERQNYYKFLAPIVDEVLRRGMRAICLHDYRNDQTRFVGLKADYFAQLSTSPQFYQGTPAIVSWRNTNDIIELIAREGARYVYSLHSPTHFGLEDGAWKRSEVIWIQLQHGADSFIDGVGTREADIFARYSKSWADHFLESPCGNAYDVGFPALDSVNYDNVAIRQKYVLQEKAPIILYFAGDNPRLQWMPGVFNRLWYRFIFSDDSWTGGFEFVAKLLSCITVTELSLLKALRAYADQKGALLLLKSRSKRRLSPLICSYADRVFYDESLYPATNFELMSTASLVVCIASTAQLEAAYFGTPSISLYPEGLARIFISLVDSIFPGKPSRYMRSVADFISNLRGGDLQIPPIPRADISEWFGDSVSSAKRIVDLAVQHPKVDQHQRNLDPEKLSSEVSRLP